MNLATGAKRAHPCFSQAFCTYLNAPPEHFYIRTPTTFPTLRVFFFQTQCTHECFHTESLIADFRLQVV